MNKMSKDFDVWRQTGTKEVEKDREPKSNFLVSRKEDEIEITVTIDFSWNFNCG